MEDSATFAENWCVDGSTGTTELALLKNKIEGKELWWERIAGTIENDPIYAKAMKLGRQYRQSQRSRPSRKRP